MLVPLGCLRAWLKPLAQVHESERGEEASDDECDGDEVSHGCTCSLAKRANRQWLKHRLERRGCRSAEHKGTLQVHKPGIKTQLRQTPNDPAPSH